MKNLIYTNKQEDKVRALSSFTSLTTIMVVILVLVSGFCNAQKYSRKKPTQFGAGIDHVSSGDGHGAFLTPYMVFKKGRRSVNMYMLFHQRSKEISGGKIALSYNLSGGKKPRYADDDDDEQSSSNEPRKQILQLNAFCFSQYIHNTLLSNKTCLLEERASYNKEQTWQQVRLSTVSAGVGFELHFKITKRLTWKNSVGGSVFYHLNNIPGMYSEKLAPSLLLGTGFIICPL